MKVAVLVIISLVSLGIARGQSKKDDLSIKMVVTTASIQQGEFVVKIDKVGDVLKMVYSFRDSIAKACYKDEKFLSLSSSMKKFNPANPSENANIFRALDSLKKKYSYYSKDSILLNASTVSSFTNLLEKIVTTSKEELENLDVSKKRSFLDGAYYSFVIESNTD